MIMELLNGTRFDIEDYNLKRLYHYIPSPKVYHNTSIVEGIGEVITHTQFENRIISVDLRYRVKDIYDFYLLRDELNGLFIRDEPFYIIFKKEPYKRYKVRLARDFNLQPNRQMEKFTLEFIPVNRFAESVATTADLKEWDVDKWGWNNVIDWDGTLEYIFNTSTFTVNNLGTAPVDPRENYLGVKIISNSNNLRIRNLTTGDVYEFNDTLTIDDVLNLEGLKTYKNGVSSFRNTNKKIITLAAGANNFEIEGATVLNIAFNFRFLFK